MGVGSVRVAVWGNVDPGEEDVDCGGPCPVCETCNDGIWNGEEEGLDCGGPDCLACPPCNNLTLTLVLDNYPEETSWYILSGNTTVLSGGPYGDEADGATVVEDICLNGGCYDLVMQDLYQDGMCCSYGEGSYTLTTGSGMVLASGGEFGSSETTSFCISNPSCDDGIQNGDETGVDCGGSCPACVAECLSVDLSSCIVSPYGDGEDAGSFTVGAGYIVVYNNAWKSIALDYTITANTIIEFEFASTAQGEIHAIGFDNNSAYSEDFTFQLYGTQNWGISDYNNYTEFGYWKSYTIPVGQYYTGAMDRLFFLADHDGGYRNGNSYFKNIKIYEGSCDGVSPVFNSYVRGKVSPNMDKIKGDVGADVLAQVNLSPNPAKDVLTINLDAAFVDGQITIVDLHGKVMLEKTVADVNMNLNVSDLAAGMYFLQLQNGNWIQVERFVVER